MPDRRTCRGQAGPGTQSWTLRTPCSICRCMNRKSSPEPLRWRSCPRALRSLPNGPTCQPAHAPSAVGNHRCGANDRGWHATADDSSGAAAKSGPRAGPPQKAAAHAPAQTVDGPRQNPLAHRNAPPASLPDALAHSGWRCLRPRSSRPISHPARRRSHSFARAGNYLQAHRWQSVGSSGP